MAPFELPEVQRVDLCGAALALHSWGVRDLGEFAWYESPPTDRLEAARQLLTTLGALVPVDRRLTAMGKQMLALPVHPRLARLLIASANEGRVAEGAALAALLSEKDIVQREFQHPGIVRARGRILPGS
jgi:ATP-dependent helicase HrpB